MSDGASPPKPFQKEGAASFLTPKWGVVGEVIVSFSSSSTSLCIGPDSDLPGAPNGFAFPKGLVKPVLDIVTLIATDGSL